MSRSQDDCHLYYNSTCPKGDLCSLRHEPAAKYSGTICMFWNQGECQTPNCSFRYFTGTIHNVTQNPFIMHLIFYENSVLSFLERLKDLFWNLLFIRVRFMPFDYTHSILLLFYKQRFISNDFPTKRTLYSFFKNQATLSKIDDYHKQH